MSARYILWKPENDQGRDEVRRALDDVLDSSHFRNSRRYPTLLRYLVEEALAGRVDDIKERTLGIEVFGRPADYDTNTDTAVRYTAGEIRKRLTLYYHAHPDASVQIALTTRSYAPEFLLAQEEETAEEIAAEPTTHLVSGVAVPDGRWRTLAISLSAVLLCLLLAATAVPLWRTLRPDPVRAFWGPFLRPDTTALLCPGGNVFDPTIEGNARPADERTPAPYLSFGNGIALSRVAADIRSLGGHYTIQAASATALSHLSEHPAILIGAYNNPWTERLLQPLRFHFSQLPQRGIVDTQHPERVIQRAPDDNVENSPDYAIVARFRSNSTGNMVVVVAGLKRFGTDAASQFLSSAESLQQLDMRLGRDWHKRNIEVLIKTDVASARVGAPQILDAYDW